MPASEEEIAAILTRFLPDADEATVEYLVAAVSDASSLEELTEACEGHLEDDCEAAVAELQVALGLGAAKSAEPEPLKSLPGGKLGAIAKVNFDQAGSFDPSAPSPELSDDDQNTQKDKKKGVAAKKKAVAKSGYNAATLPQLDDVVDVSAQVSRFHKELVEDENTSLVADVDIKGITLVVADLTLLEDADLKLVPGQRYGFIGRNGCGKSTLMRMMEQKRIPGYPANCITLLVAQEDVGDDRNAVDTVLSANTELMTCLAEETALSPCEDGGDEHGTRAVRAFGLLKAREELRKAKAFESKSSGQRGRDARKALLEAEAKEREAELLCEKVGEVDPGAASKAVQLLADVRDQLRILDRGALRAQAEILLKGLGFSTEDLACNTERLSGGWRMRIALAKALSAKPNVLLLDEPTNHLDWAAVLWFEKYLQSSDMEKVALVVVSHDRAFLDNVCTMTLRCHSKQLQTYDGNYSAFEKSHKEDQQHRADLAAKVAEKRSIVEKQMLEMEKKGREQNNEKLLKQVASRKNKLGLNAGVTTFNRVGLEGVGGHKWKASYGDGSSAAEAAMTLEAPEANVKLKIKCAAALGTDAAQLQCQGVVVGYEASTPLIKKFDLDIRMTSRIGLLGVNGSGKTTLLRTLTKELAPLKGEVYQQPRVILGFFNQHQADVLPLGISAVQVMMERFPGTDEAERAREIRTHLGSFGLSRQAVQPIGTLSGGEKCRVALAAITFRPPHILLLDEPTNHLDLQTVEALGKALNEFEGGVVVASHDRRLLKEVCKEYYAVQGGQLKKTAMDDFVKAVRKGIGC